MKSLIIIEHEPLTPRLNQIWNIDLIKARGIHVEYWDISQLIYPGIYIPDNIQKDYIIYIHSLDDLYINLKRLDVEKCIMAVEFFQIWENRSIWAMLNHFNCKCIKVDLYANTNIKDAYKRDLITKLKQFSVLKFCKKVLWLFYYKFFLTNIRIQLLSSSSLANPNIYINHPDYEKFIYDEEVPAVQNQKYAVFIDTFYPLHPDLSFYFNAATHNIDVDEYRRLMCNFFDYLEIKYNLNIVIAAHPKSIYNGSEFGNRLIFKNRTANLIKYSNFVITHESNSISYIALSNKPFVMVYPKSYKTIYFLYNYITALAKVCGRQAYDIDSCNWNDIEITPLDIEIRNNYIYTYLTSQITDKRRNVDIFCELLV